MTRPVARHAAIATLLLLSACAVGPDFERPIPWWNPAAWFSDPSPAAGDASEAVAEPVDPHWWRIFGDPDLTRLEQRLGDANLDVRVAGIRLMQARAAVGVAQAAGLPSVNGNASYTREQLSQKGVLSLSPGANAASQANGLPGAGASVQNPGLFAPFDLFQYGFDASWEIDFWGRVRRSVESADASLTAAQDARRDTLVTATAELARAYVQLRGVQRRIEITRQNLGIAQQSLVLTRQRAVGGLTTDLDVANAAAQVSSTASQIPPLEAQQAQLINAIGFLLGEAPAALAGELVPPRAIPPVPPRVPVGLPSELARRRPDIRRAEAQLHAATAEVGVAVADFYPRLTLSASAAVQGVQFRDLADWGHAGTYALGPSVTLPVFEGGRLRRTLELRQAQQQEAAVLYQRTVLNALHEVDNALSAYAAEQRRRAELERAVAQNRRALALARDRYAQGVADFLQVLDVQRNLLAAEQQLTDSTTSVSTNLVQIYKALGGGWENDFPETPPAARQAVL
ncbi:Efflux transporter outer membrane subunit [Rhodovastum atsumiense]|uniref:Efflux transporter outer membrane subunit n=1 Tax=Rhodovastum atsumiense TaxID=504468 RepID=A0A5M6IUP1_9PROT|nr:efflux transporter outer membrane subunit [Rhodovastum atsumiense]KAA5612033.1 efflux transporter outer membrane subunit [Rhodovastum atsumiense]CAH2604103.1 Efflux transporter outer membrane subunit [Rhodovastum atsumiense]